MKREANFPKAPPAVAVRVAVALHRFVRRLADSLVPADIAVFLRAVGANETAMLGVAARHGFADLLAHEPMTAAQLAAKAGTNEDATHRILRALAWSGVFRLHGDGRFSNNRLSTVLLRDHESHGKQLCQYVASESNGRAWLNLEHTAIHGTNAFVPSNGQSVWAWFDEHPDEREAFAQCMTALTRRQAPVIARLYPFGEITTICDVGGGRGSLLSELLVQHPHLRGVLCDAPGVVESSQPFLQARGVFDRVTLSPGNFFVEIPTGADAYIMKTVLHDWDDARCGEILRVVRRAMKPGARLLLAELLIERNQVSVGVLSDVQMMTVCDEGRERSLAEFHHLLTTNGFAPARVFRYPTIAVIEAIAQA